MKLAQSHSSKVHVSLLLLDVKEGDHFCLFQQEMSSPSMEDGLAGWGINFFSHFILQILDNNLSVESVQGSRGQDGVEREGWRRREKCTGKSTARREGRYVRGKVKSVDVEEMGRAGKCVTE